MSPAVVSSRAKSKTKTKAQSQNSRANDRPTAKRKATSRKAGKENESASYDAYADLSRSTVDVGRDSIPTSTAKIPPWRSTMGNTGGTTSTTTTATVTVEALATATVDSESTAGTIAELGTAATTAAETTATTTAETTASTSTETTTTPTPETTGKPTTCTLPELPSPPDPEPEPVPDPLSGSTIPLSTLIRMDDKDPYRRYYGRRILIVSGIYKMYKGYLRSTQPDGRVIVELDARTETRKRVEVSFADVSLLADDEATTCFPPLTNASLPTSYPLPLGPPVSLPILQQQEAGASERSCTPPPPTSEVAPNASGNGNSNNDSTNATAAREDNPWNTRYPYSPDHVRWLRDPVYDDLRVKLVLVPSASSSSYTSPTLSTPSSSSSSSSTSTPSAPKEPCIGEYCGPVVTYPGINPDSADGGAPLSLPLPSPLPVPSPSPSQSPLAPTSSFLPPFPTPLPPPFPGHALLIRSTTHACVRFTRPPADIQHLAVPYADLRTVLPTRKGDEVVPTFGEHAGRRLRVYVYGADSCVLRPIGVWGKLKNGKGNGKGKREIEYPTESLAAVFPARKK